MAQPNKLDPNEAKLIEPAPRPPASPTPTDDRSIGDLIGELANETTTLVKQEVALAKKEIKEEVRVAGKNIGYTVAGGAVAYVGLIAIVIGLGWLLGELLADAEWLGLLIVGLIVAAVGYSLLKKGLEKLKRMDPAPDRTLRTLKEDKEWLKSETP